MITENEVVLAIDNIRSMLGELKSMAHNYEVLKRSRDRWKKLAGERESERDACWVKLPTDISGETIHHGDLLVDSDGVTFRANELVLGESGWMLRYMGDDVFPVDTIHVEEQRTVEDVLDEVSRRAYANESERCDVLLESAKEIRELLGVDDEE